MIDWLAPASQYVSLLQKGWMPELNNVTGKHQWQRSDLGVKSPLLFKLLSTGTSPPRLPRVLRAATTPGIAATWVCLLCSLARNTTR